MGKELVVVGYGKGGSKVNSNSKENLGLLSSESPVVSNIPDFCVKRCDDVTNRPQDQEGRPYRVFICYESLVEMQSCFS